MQCCGVESYDEWKDYDLPVPDSCCKMPNCNTKNPSNINAMVWFTYSTVVLYIQMTLIILFQLPWKLFISLGMLHNGRNVYQLLGETHRSCVFGSGRISHSRSWIDLHVGQLHKQMEIWNDPLNQRKMEIRPNLFNLFFLFLKLKFFAFISANILKILQPLKKISFFILYI